MTASAVYGTQLTLHNANPVVKDSRSTDNYLRSAVGGIAAATTSIDEAGDIIHLVELPTNTTIRAIRILADDLDTHSTPALAYDVGLYYGGNSSVQTKTLGKTRGTVLDADAFASAITTGQSAAVDPVGIAWEARNIDTYKKPLWEHGALSYDPGGTFLISLTITTAAATAAAGDIVLEVVYV